MPPRITCDCELPSCVKCMKRTWSRRARAAKREGTYQADPKRQAIGSLPKVHADPDVEARMDRQAAATLPAMRAYREPRHYTVPTVIPPHWRFNA